jgi:hypothetical protein
MKFYKVKKSFALLHYVNIYIVYKNEFDTNVFILKKTILTSNVCDKQGIEHTNIISKKISNYNSNFVYMCF